MEKAQSKQNDKSKKLGFEIFKFLVVSIQIPINMVLTFFYGTYLEIIICMASFMSLRYCFPKTYHCNTLFKCMSTTAVIFWIANIYMIAIGIHISILINILVGLLIGYILYLVQDYIDLKSTKKKIKHNRDKIIELLKGDASLDNIKYVCKTHGMLEETAIIIDDFLKKTLEQVCYDRNYSATAIKKKIRKFIESVE